MGVLEMLMEKKPLLLKFTKKEYAESLLKGNIYMNSLHTFKSIEDKGAEMTQDIYEAMEHVTQSNEFEYLYVPNGNPDGSDWLFPSKHLIGGVWRPNNDHQFFKAFCMFEMKYDAEEKNIYPIDPRILDFGDTYVLITNIIEFTKRLDKAILANSDEIEPMVVFGPVTYFDEMKYSGALGPFKKRETYSWQNEWRICLDLKQKNQDAYCLNIGDISDIAIMGNTKKMVEYIRFLDDDSIYFDQ